MFYQIPLFLNLGTQEIILIMFVVLLLFGGKKLPELARGLGKGLRDFKDASEGLKTEINNQINQVEEMKNEALSDNTTAAETEVSSVNNPGVAANESSEAVADENNAQIAYETPEEITYENNTGPDEQYHYLDSEITYENPATESEPLNETTISKEKLKA